MIPQIALRVLLKWNCLVTDGMNQRRKPNAYRRCGARLELYGKPNTLLQTNHVMQVRSKTHSTFTWRWALWLKYIKSACLNFIKYRPETQQEAHYLGVVGLTKHIIGKGCWDRCWLLGSMHVRAKCGGKEYPIQSTHWLVPYRQLTRQSPVRICCWVPPQTAEPRTLEAGAIKTLIARLLWNGVWNCSRLIQPP
jgi:hypothetical protein